MLNQVQLSGGDQRQHADQKQQKQRNLEIAPQGGVGYARIRPLRMRTARSIIAGADIAQSSLTSGSAALPGPRETVISTL